MKFYCAVGDFLRTNCVPSRTNMLNDSGQLFSPVWISESSVKWVTWAGFPPPAPPPPSQIFWEVQDWLNEKELCGQTCFGNSCKRVFTFYFASNIISYSEAFIGCLLSQAPWEAEPSSRDTAAHWRMSLRGKAHHSQFQGNCGVRSAGQGGPQGYWALTVVGAAQLKGGGSREKRK